jgi:hypothetical protein
MHCCYQQLYKHLASPATFSARATIAASKAIADCIATFLLRPALSTFDQQTMTSWRKELCR